MTTDLRAAIAGLMPRAWEDLARLVAVPSVADARQVPPEECRRAARLTADAFAAAGVPDVGLVEMADQSTAVIGHAPGPPGAPTVLLYCHHDVQPSFDPGLWASPPFTLTARDGRWYGRGAADCKGGVVVHLTALRALRGRLPVSVIVVSEGSEEQGTGGLERFVESRPEVLRADAIVICDAGNVVRGVPTLTTALRGMCDVTVTVRALASAQHSGMVGGAAPDPLAALVRMLTALHDDRGNVAVPGLPGGQRWAGVQYPPERFRADATVLDGVELVGDGTVADMVWARPAITVIGIDAPPVVGSVNAVQAEARARVSLRVPPGTGAGPARDALAAHLVAVAPWGVRVAVENGGIGDPFVAETDGPAYRAMTAALGAAYGREVTSMGQGGSIPLATTLQRTYPDAEIMLIGVSEPACRIHAPDESVDPAEIEAIALAEALFLEAYGAAARGTPP